MKLYLQALTLGALILTVGMYVYSPAVTRAIIDPRFTPAYWNRRAP